MYELSWRANINVYSAHILGDTKQVIIYEDHRTLLNVLYYARMKGITTVPVHLLYFDNHDDACVMRTIEKYKSYSPRKFDQNEFEKFWNFVEFKLSANDDNWLYAGMKFNLIKNAFRIAGEQNDNIDELNNKFHGRHRLEPIGADMIFQLTEEFLDKIQDNKRRAYVLDFDLDCFTEYKKKRKAWSNRKFQEFFDDGVLKRRYDIQRLARQAEFITICREPICCGGIKEANKILSYLDKYIFEGELDA